LHSIKIIFAQFFNFFCILNYWKKYGLEATKDAFGAKRPTLYYWQKLYKDSEYKIKRLNPGKTIRKNKNKREIQVESG